jgi:hypothetical protein
MVELMDISKEDFISYEEVRVSGITNMWDVEVVMLESGLDRDKIMCIMSNYGKLMEIYPGVRK